MIAALIAMLTVNISYAIKFDCLLTETARKFLRE